jgi:hypothetical protein
MDAMLQFRGLHAGEMRPEQIFGRLACEGGRRQHKNRLISVEEVFTCVARLVEPDGERVLFTHR